MGQWVKILFGYDGEDDDDDDDDGGGGGGGGGEGGNIKLLQVRSEIHTAV
jgi:hypothetical protein